MPTILDLLGREAPVGIDGQSVVPAVRGKVPAPQSILFGVPVPVDGVTEEGVDRGWRGVRTERTTYAQWEDGSPWVLYDNQADPCQRDNLVEDRGAARLRDDMESELRRQLARSRDEFLCWQDHLRDAGLVDAWNLREQVCNREAARSVSLSHVR